MPKMPDRAMRIAPVTERWNEGERDWSFVRDPAAAIEVWEGLESVSLPADYRAFMLRYNGGRIYPRMFRTPAAMQVLLGPYVATSDVTYVDPIHDWATVEAHWRGQVYGQGVPPAHLLIASTPGAIQLLMALAPTNRGEICAWIHSTDAWGTDRNQQIWPLAMGFGEFLDGLFDDEQRSDYLNWRRPIYDTLAKALQR